MYSRFLTQGIESCCIKRQVQILNIIFEAIQQGYQGNFFTDDQLTGLIEYANKLCGDSTMGSMDQDDILAPTAINQSQGGTGGGSGTTTIYDWNGDIITVGVTWQPVVFKYVLGNSGTSWFFSSLLSYDSTGQFVGVEVRNRTKDGFEIKALQANTTVEWEARLRNQ